MEYRLRCPFCRRHFKNERGLEMHIVIGHGKEDFKRYLKNKYARVLKLVGRKERITRKDLEMILGMDGREASYALVVLTRYGLLVGGGEDKLNYSYRLPDA